MRDRAPGAWRPSACAVLFGVAMASTAHGAAAQPAAREQPILVVVVPSHEAHEAGNAGDRAAGTIAAHLRSLDVRLEVVRDDPRDVDEAFIAARSRDLAGERHARGVLWVGAGKGVLALYLFQSEGEHLFGRRVPAAKGQLSAAVEALALIAGSAAAELLEGKVVALTLVEPAKPVAPPPPPAAPEPAPEPVLRPMLAPLADVVTADRIEPRRSPSSLAFSAGYVGNNQSAAWRSAFAVAAGGRPTPNVTLGIGYEFAAADGVGGSRADSRQSQQRHPVFAVGGYRLHFNPRWDLELGGRTTVDVVTHSDGRAQGAGPSHGGGDDAEVRGSLGPTAELGFRVLPPLRLGLLAGMDVVLNPASTSGAETVDRFRFITGLGAQLDLALPGKRAPRQTASR